PPTAPDASVRRSVAPRIRGREPELERRPPTTPDASVRRLAAPWIRGPLPRAPGGTRRQASAASVALRKVSTTAWLARSRYLPLRMSNPIGRVIEASSGRQTIVP